MRKAPWPDHEGNDICEGDIIEHPSGEKGEVLFLRNFDTPGDQWRVKYENNRLGRLCLQIGFKGQAVKAL